MKKKLSYEDFVKMLIDGHKLYVVGSNLMYVIDCGSMLTLENALDRSGFFKDNSGDTYCIDIKVLYDKFKEKDIKLIEFIEY